MTYKNKIIPFVIKTSNLEQRSNNCRRILIMKINLLRLNVYHNFSEIKYKVDGITIFNIKSPITLYYGIGNKKQLPKCGDNRI